MAAVNSVMNSETLQAATLVDCSAIFSRARWIMSCSYCMTSPIPTRTHPAADSGSVASQCIHRGNPCRMRPGPSNRNSSNAVRPPLQDDHAAGNVRFHAVFRGDEDVEIFIRRSSFEAALKVLIDTQRPQQFRFFATRLDPHQISSFGWRERLWRGHVFYLDFYLGVIVAVIVGHDFSHGR